MKKKAIKLATSTAIAATAFVAAAPANQADAATNVEELVKTAEATAKVLKWSISIEGTGDGETRPWAAYNNAKISYNNAKAAASKLSGSAKLNYEARLLESEIQIKRAMHYIDAITAGEKITAAKTALSTAINANDLDQVETKYHALTKEIRKQAILLDRVYGQSTRDLIRDNYKKTAEALANTVKVEVTVKMELDLAAEAVKSGKYADAAKHIAEANTWLAQVDQWKTELTKNRDDVVASLPLTVTEVTRVNATTVTVKFNKELTSAHVTDFTFNNGLVVSAVSLGNDKKTVTLTVAGEKPGTTYSLSYKGASTGLSYSTAAVPSNPIIDVDNKDVTYLENGASRSYQFNLKNHNGTPFNGYVTLDLRELDADRTATANVAPNTAGEAELWFTSTTGTISQVSGNTGTFLVADGKVNLIVKGIDEGKYAPVVSFDANADGDTTDANEKLTGGTTVFYELATQAANNIVVNNVDKTNNYFATSSYVKYKFDSNDVFRVKGQAVTFDQFKAALSKTDKVDALVYSTTQSDVSIFNITENYSENILTVNTVPERVDSPTYTLSGKGEPGAVVLVKDATSNNTLGTAEVNSNGSWTYQVNLNTEQSSKLFSYNLYQIVKGTESAPVYTHSSTPENVNIYAGKFKITDVAQANSVLTLTFTQYDDVEVKAGATVTLRDADSTYVYTIGKDGTSAVGVDTVDSFDGDDKLDITLGVPTLKAGNNNGLTGNVVIDSVTGVTNQSNLTLDIGNFVVPFTTPAAAAPSTEE
ncbi:Ig-like domain-containing protein [Bacillus infantis]|uniref:Ig-like domain-containing protein n=1 Tax=Bacillus infantis TaxID=324767 RepID=UPI00209E598C|nr:Ig-like domain-containing protein [Bacillus infantis]MCP1160731.1 Ig-like domain-containing protein [Bacillus infantis]